MSPPTQREIDDVDWGGINDGLVAAAAEPRDPDPGVRALQDRREDAAAHGEWREAAELDRQVWDRRTPELDFGDEEMGS